MRVKGKIKINNVSPLTSDLVGVYFMFEDKKYVWQTNSWRKGNKIAYSINGEEYNVSFTIMDDGRNVKNVRILN
jgi:hypothetical protein